MTVRINVGQCSLLGNYRENNEDAVEVKTITDGNNSLTICVVADGMGGQAAGERASQLAVEVIPRELGTTTGQATSADDYKKCMRDAVVRANDEIIKLGDLDRNFKNMGTTVVIATWAPHFRDDCLFIAGVGDSRCYLCREGKIEQLTVDHSLARALVEAGTISDEEASEHRFRHVLWKYLGSKEVGDGPDVKTLYIRPGDVILMCTDGLSGVVTDDQLLQTIQDHSDPQECADVLGQLALDSGSRDNVSCIVIGIKEE